MAIPMDEKATCELCGEPMPNGEETFRYHGFSGPCPKPPLPKAAPRPEMPGFTEEAARLVDAWRQEHSDEIFGRISDAGLGELTRMIATALAKQYNDIAAAKMEWDDKVEFTDDENRSEKRRLRRNFVESK